MEFLFITNTTVKEYDQKNWWIDKNTVPEFRIKASSLKEALEKYRQLVEEKAYVSVSASAIQNKQPMYHDLSSGQVEQIGWIITGSTDLCESYGTYKKKYLDLWVEVLQVDKPNFDE